MTLKIPRRLYDGLAELMEGAGFHSVTELCVFVLRDLAAPRREADPLRLDADEVEALRLRLRARGSL